jgi:hypothetical protein
VVGWFAADDMGLNAKPVARVYGSNGTASPGPVESIAGAGVSGLGNLAVSDSGSALFTWPQPLNGKGTVYVASRPPAGPFGPAVQASDGSSNAYTAATELDTLGDGLVTFLQQDGTPYRAHARGFDVTPPQLTSFSVPPTAVVGMPAAFAAQAFDLWGPITFGWDFGDGSGTGATLSHAFGGAGAHQVTVTATDSAGNASSQSGSVNVAPALAPVIAPVLSAVSLTHRTFRVGKRATAIIAKRRKKKVPTGTTIRFTLDRAASVAIRADRSLSGRRSGKRCVKPTKRLRRAKHCTRFVKAGASLTRNAKVGRNNVGFSGRIGKRAIAPGSYRLTLVPSVPGATGKSRQTTFKVVR